jgi:hypothetical protein
MIEEFKKTVSYDEAKEPAGEAKKPATDAQRPATEAKKPVEAKA